MLLLGSERGKTQLPLARRASAGQRRRGLRYWVIGDGCPGAGCPWWRGPIAVPSSVGGCRRAVGASSSENQQAETRDCGRRKARSSARGRAVLRDSQPMELEQRKTGLGGAKNFHFSELRVLLSAATGTALHGTVRMAGHGRIPPRLGFQTTARADRGRLTLLGDPQPG